MYTTATTVLYLEVMPEIFFRIYMSNRKIVSGQLYPVFGLQYLSVVNIYSGLCECVILFGTLNARHTLKRRSGKFREVEI